MPQDFIYRVVVRAMLASSSTDLSSVLQQGSSRSMLAMKDLEDSLERALKLINHHDQKESIYAEAGDLISNVRGQIEEIKEGLNIVTYASAKITEKKLRNQVPVKVRDQVDQSVKRDK
jgi:hypothetical protein